MTLRAKETLVGVFILTGLAALVWLTLFVGNWAAITGGAGYRVTAKFENIGGLTVKSPVTLAGVTIGRVSSISSDREDYSAIVTLSIDTTGPGLNKRGYRAHMDKAPLRETLAAGLLLLSRWRPHKDTLYDPFCGTGTILIEAAMIAQNRAPGLYREFAAEKWKLIPKKCWKTARETAISQIKLNVESN